MRAPAVILLAGLLACGGKSTPATTKATEIEIKGPTDRVIPLLPNGAQVVVELDLARLRGNAVVGELVTGALTGTALGAMKDVLPEDLPPIGPLAEADAMVLAAYGVGTPNAASVTILVTKTAPDGGVRLADDIWALGPAEWTAQLEARAAIAGIDAVTAQVEPDLADGKTAAERGAPPKIPAEAELVALRDHAMPERAPGAFFRLSARLSFDARVELARELGLDLVPAQLSIWADVVDDFAIIIDVETPDQENGKRTAAARKRTEKTMQRLLASIAAEPAIKLLGLAPAIDRARFVDQGPWLRTIIAIGPDRLGRAVARAKEYLAKEPS